MGPVLLIAVIVVMSVAAAAAWLFLRRSPPAAPIVPTTPLEEDPRVRAARHLAVDEQGSELLQRRVELDGRRGTLAGDSEVYDAFDALEKQFHAGDISEDEFEQGKIRLLGGYDA